MFCLLSTFVCNFLPTAPTAVCYLAPKTLRIAVCLLWLLPSLCFDNLSISHRSFTTVDHPTFTNTNDAVYFHGTKGRSYPAAAKDCQGCRCASLSVWSWFSPTGCSRRGSLVHLRPKLALAEGVDHDNDKTIGGLFYLQRVGPIMDTASLAGSAFSGQHLEAFGDYRTVQGA